MNAPTSRYNTGFVNDNPEMANAISQSPVFAAIQQELDHERQTQAMKYLYMYSVSGQVIGQQTLPFVITIEQGTDFKSVFMLGSAFSYSVANASTFPIPNSAGVADWAGRGLSVDITDSKSGRKLTSGFVAWELLFTPGYGMNFQNPFPFKYLFSRNSKIVFDVRNRDNANRTHNFDIVLVGFKIETPA